MEAPEYLDLDEIDFSDDAVYCVASLKNIPELSRRSDVQGEERAAPPVTWSRSGSSHGSGGGVKPPGLPEVHSKFRPVKRVSPLKHQPETSDADPDGKTQNQEVQVLQGGGNNKEAPPPDRGGQASSSEAPGGKAKGVAGASAAPQALFGELEHYDLDMDEILDVPYIKSSQQTSTLPRTPHDKHPAPSLVGGTLDRKRGGGLKGASLARHEPLSLGSSSQTPYCVLSPVKWSDLRKSKSMDPDLHHLHRPAGGAVYQAELSSSGLLSCSSSLSSFSDADKLLSARVYPDSQSQKPSMDLQGGSGLTFPLAGCSVGRQDGSKARPPGAGSSRAGELDDETKKNNNIINIIREGQISLLPHLAADNLELIRDEQMNNLLHVAASQGHADCLQHLTSLMGEDGLNERNAQQLTPAGLGVKHGHLECVRWMVSETEAIAELSCSREHPSLIHYAAQYGQEKVLLWLLQFMQEQAISLDEVDQNGNTAVHIAAQYGHLTCIQTLVEYGSNVTVQNQQSERPSQTAERQGNPTCARYLVVVETCMSLASQVVKLTKQLNEQATERLALQNQLHRILEPKTEGMPSASSHQPSGEAWPEMILTAEGSAADGHWVVRQGGGALDPALRQLLGKDVSDVLCPNGRPPVSGAREPGGPGGRRAGLAERRELKLARLKQLMQRSLSESDSDGYPPEDGKAPGGPRPERPSHLPVAPDEPVTKHLHLAMKRHLPSSSSSQGGAKPADGGPGSSSPNSSDPDPQDGRRDGEVQDQKATSPKSALKSPSSRRKSAHALKLRVTFDEQVHKSSAPEAEPSKVHHGKERTPSSGSENKRPFGAFRSIMESLSGNTNHNNNTAATGSCPATPAASGSVQNTASRKQTDSKGPGGGKAKSKTSNV